MEHNLYHICYLEFDKIYKEIVCKLKFGTNYLNNLISLVPLFHALIEKIRTSSQISYAGEMAKKMTQFHFIFNFQRNIAEETFSFCSDLLCYLEAKKKVTVNVIIRNLGVLFSKNVRVLNFLHWDP